MNKKIKFSIIMPTYNRAFCIIDAINHVLKQVYKNFELIIIDDGSNDGTDKLIQKRYAKEIKSGKIVYKKLEKNSGVCYARNEALKLAKNEWIAYCDTDNKMLKNHLKSFADAIIENPKRLTFYARIKHRNSGIEYGKPFNYNDLTKSNFIDMGVFVHNISLYKKYGGFDENIKRLVDYDLILTYTKHNKPIFIDKILLDYNDDDNIKRITNSEKFNLDYIRRKHKIKEIKEKKKFKVFDKVKLKNGRRHIYLFGMKIISYREKR
ncbi:MAG: glycosyltransferase family 2 protein [Endomicrobiaceae bacterium]